MGATRHHQFDIIRSCALPPPHTYTRKARTHFKKCTESTEAVTHGRRASDFADMPAHRSIHFSTCGCGKYGGNGRRKRCGRYGDVDSADHWMVTEIASPHFQSHMFGPTQIVLHP
eukprot:339685-Chlamydomonas_euryale.AAC.2